MVFYTIYAQNKRIVWDGARAHYAQSIEISDKEAEPDRLELVRVLGGKTELPTSLVTYWSSSAVIYSESSGVGYSAVPRTYKVRFQFGEKLVRFYMKVEPGWKIDCDQGTGEILAEVATNPEESVDCIVPPFVIYK